MLSDLEDELKMAGDRLNEEHDEETVRAVIDEVEALDDENSQDTADLLRHMTGIEE